MITFRRRCIAYFLTWAVLLGSVAQGADDSQTPAGKDFVAGQMLYRTDSSYQTLDPKTLADLETNQLVIKWMQQFAPSPMSAQRMAWLFQHPYMDADEIQRRQQAIRAIADDDNLFDLLEQVYERDPVRRKDHQINWLNKAGWGNAIQDFITFDMAIFATVLARVMMSSVMDPKGMTPQQITALNHTMLLLPLIMSALMGGAMGQYYNQMVADILVSKDRSRQLIEVRDNPDFASFEFGKEIQKACRAFSPCIDRVSLWGRGVPNSGFLRGLQPIFLVAGIMSLGPRIYSILHRKSLLKIISAAVELETIYAFAKYYRAYRSQLNFPTILKQARPRFVIREGHHPYLLFDPQQESAANSISLLDYGSPTGKGTYILTGPNTGGKTTYLRMIGNLGIMAQAGLPVPVQSMELTPIQYIANFASVNDTVTQGHSTFFAQSKGVGDIGERLASVAPQPVLVMMDEILTGTSKEEHNALERAVLEDLHQRPNVFTLLATHDRTLTTLEREVDGAGNLHVTLSGHRIELGPSTDFNAFATAERAGVSGSILNRAIEIFRSRNPDVACIPLLGDKASGQ